MKSKKIIGLSIASVVLLAPTVQASTTIGTLSNLENEQAQVKTKIQQENEAIQNIESHQTELNSDLQTLDDRIQELEISIFEQHSEILESKQKVYNLSTATDEIKQRLEKRTSLMKDRALTLQKEHSSVTYLNIIFGAESFSNLLDRLNAIHLIVKSDQSLIKQFESDQEEYERLYKEQDDKLDQLETLNANLKKLENELIAEQARKQKLVKVLNESKTNRAENKIKLEEKNGKLQKEIDSLKQPINSTYSLPPIEAAGGMYNFDVRNMSNLTIEQLESALSGKLKGYGAKYYEVGHKYGIEPAFLVGISMAETGGTAIDHRNNIGGFMKRKGGKMTFSSIDASIEYMGLLLTRLYIRDGLVTVEQIHKRYSPEGASNDPTNLNVNWVSNVYKFMAKAGIQF